MLDQMLKSLMFLNSNRIFFQVLSTVLIDVPLFNYLTREYVYSDSLAQVQRKLRLRGVEVKEIVELLVLEVPAFTNDYQIFRNTISLYSLVNANSRAPWHVNSRHLSELWKM
jgi:hypothetical protein